MAVDRGGIGERMRIEEEKDRESNFGSVLGLEVE